MLSIPESRRRIDDQRELTIPVQRRHIEIQDRIRRPQGNRSLWCSLRKPHDAVPQGLSPEVVEVLARGSDGLNSPPPVP